MSSELVANPNNLTNLKLTRLALNFLLGQPFAGVYVFPQTPRPFSVEVGDPFKFHIVYASSFPNEEPLCVPLVLSEQIITLYAYAKLYEEHDELDIPLWRVDYSMLTMDKAKESFVATLVGMEKPLRSLLLSAQTSKSLCCLCKDIANDAILNEMREILASRESLNVAVRRKEYWPFEETSMVNFNFALYKSAFYMRHYYAQQMVTGRVVSTAVTPMWSNPNGSEKTDGAEEDERGRLLPSLSPSELAKLS